MTFKASWNRTIATTFEKTRIHCNSDVFATVAVNVAKAEFPQIGRRLALTSNIAQARIQEKNVTVSRFKKKNSPCVERYFPYLNLGISFYSKTIYLL